MAGDERDDTYITFHTINEARQAMQKNGHLICQYPVTLSICSNTEIQNRDIDQNQNVVGHEEQFVRQSKIFENFLLLRLTIKHTVIVVNGIASNRCIVLIVIVGKTHSTGWPKSHVTKRKLNICTTA